MGLYKQFIAITGANDDLEDLSHFNSCSVDSVGDTWFVKMTSAASTFTFNFYSITDPTDSNTSEGTETVSPLGMTSSNNTGRPIIRIHGTTYLAACFVSYETIVGTTYGMVTAWSTDSGSTWNSELTYSGPDTGEAAYEVLDYIIYNSLHWVVFIDTLDNLPVIVEPYVRFRQTNGGGNYDLEVSGMTSVTIGSDYLSEYWFAVHRQSDSKNYIYSFDGTALTAEEDLTGKQVLYGGTAGESKFYKTDRVEWILTGYQLSVRIFNGTWVEYNDAGGGLVTAICYNSDHKPINIVSDSDIYEINKHGLPNKLQETTDTYYVGTLDWMSNGTDIIYQIEWVNL